MNKHELARTVLLAILIVFAVGFISYTSNQVDQNFTDNLDVEPIGTNN